MSEVPLYGGGFSYERGTLVQRWLAHFNRSRSAPGPLLQYLQGYLTHKKTHPPWTLP